MCVVVKSAGIGDVNPNHPKLAELLADGATLQNFEDAAHIAVEKGKGFAYALGVAQGLRNDAKQPRKNPDSAETFRERDARLDAERMAEFAPGVARKPALATVPNNAPFDASIIDTEAANVVAIAGH